MGKSCWPGIAVTFFIILTANASRKGEDFLYDLSVDGTETHSLSGEQPEILKLIKEEYQLFAERTNVMPLGIIKAEIEKNRMRLYGNKNKESNY